MKITFDIDATPQELRDFFGLPDIQELQKDLIGRIQESMEGGIEGFDPASLMSPYMPQYLRSLEAMQKSYWDAFSTSGGVKSDESD